MKGHAALLRPLTGKENELTFVYPFLSTSKLFSSVPRLAGLEPGTGDTEVNKGLVDPAFTELGGGKQTSRK